MIIKYDDGVPTYVNGVPVKFMTNFKESEEVVWRHAMKMLRVDYVISEAHGEMAKSKGIYKGLYADAEYNYIEIFSAYRLLTGEFARA